MKKLVLRLTNGLEKTYKIKGYYIGKNHMTISYVDGIKNGSISIRLSDIESYNVEEINA